MEIQISNRQNSHEIPQEKIQQKAKAILNALDYPEGELSILILDDRQMEKMNSEYLDREGPTNVISFSMQEGSFSHFNPDLLGDVVISMDTAKREGDDADIGTEERFFELLIHGILHLIGYDHEKNEEEALKMEKKAEELKEIIQDIDTH